MMALRSRTRSFMSAAAPSGSASAALAIDAACALSPNRLGPTSSCRSSAVRRDQAAVEALIFRKRGFQRLRERIEPVGDDRKLRRLRPVEPDLIVPVLEL